MKRRLLSAFLAVMMVLTMAPVAFAANTATSDGEALSKLFTDVHAGESGSGNVTVTIDKDYDLTGYQWTSLTVQGYTGAGVVTVEGNNHKITGLNAPLFAGGFAGTSGIVVKNLTLTKVTIDDSTSKQGIGAFINNVDSMPKIELNNCHLTNSTITSTGGARVGGLIGWTSGYNKKNDGPVDTYITVTNCSVENTKITAAGSVGGIIGHAGANPATYHTFTNNTVTGCTLHSTDDGGWRVGVVVGTVNVGEVALNNTTESGNTVTQTGKMAPAGQSNLYGRFVPGTTGKLVIDGTAVFDSSIVAVVDNKGYKTLADAVAAAQGGATVKLLKDVTEDVVIPAGKTITLDLNGKKLTNVQSDTITVTKGAKLTIAGKGTVDNVTNGKAAVYNNGTTTLNGGKYTRSAEADNTTSSSGGNSYYNILNHGAMTINEGVEVYSSGHFSSLVANGYYDYSATQKGDRTAYIESVGQAAPALTINNGTFSGGINTIKNDDNATLTINNGEFSNVTQAVVQNNNIATINGGTFDADGYHALENWKYNGNYNAGNLTVTNGKFAGSIAKNEAASLKISGGLYTENPSKYLAASVKDGYKYAAVKHASPYLFEVKEILNENVEVIPNVGAAKAKSAEGVVDKDDVAKVDAAAKVVAAPKISEAAAVVADKVDAEQYTEKATNIAKADRIEVRAYLEVTPKEYSADSYKLNITPKYDIVVVGTDNQEQKFTGDTLPVSNETPVSVQLPDGFVKNTDSLYVQHKGHEYNADVSVNTVKVNGVDKNIYTAKFNNPDGFSDFTITKTTQSVAVIGNNKYTTLQNAIDAAQTGATIVLQKDCTEKVTVAGKSLTINRNGKTFNEANVTVGSNCTKEVKNDTIVVTYTKPSSGGSSGGSSSGKTTYKVTTSAVNNGGVNASPSNAEKGATITITLSPDKGYKLDKLTVTDGSGKTVSTVKKSDTVYTFTMPASAVTVGVSYAKADETPSKTTFNDVSANDWFASAVDYVTGKGMMNGTAANTFSPKANTTRGMLMTVLARHAGEDTTGGSVWYEKGMNWAKANSVSDGTNPQVNITREQLAAMLYRYAQNKKYDVSGAKSLDGYTDAQSVSSYAVPALQWANAAGVVNGKSGSKLDPKGYATRAEVAAMLMRFCENVEK